METFQTNNSEFEIKVIELKKAALIPRALRHKLRKEMMQLIHDNGRLTVTTIFIKLRLEQSVASQHLAILRKARLVLTEREGKYIFYSVNYQRVNEVMEFARNLDQHYPASC